MQHIIKDKEIEDMIYVIRGQQVMLDSDLAKLYGYEVKNFNRQVQRNLKRFPADFMFRLTKIELDYLMKCQNGTAPANFMRGNEGGRRTLPYVFTEQGIYMLTAVLKGEVAEKQSIFIIREFKRMRHILAETQLFRNEDIQRITNCLAKHEEDITDMKSTMATKSDIAKIMDNFIDDSKIKEKLFLNGRIFDAVEAYIHIFKKAKKSIFVLDNYISIDTLSLLKHKQKAVNVIIFTSIKGNDKINEFEISKFNKQYPTLSLKYTRNVHDRFIVIDYGAYDECFYVCGASSKDAGQKICTIMQFHNSEIMHCMLDNLLKSVEYKFVDEAYKRYKQ